MIDDPDEFLASLPTATVPTASVVTGLRELAAFVRGSAAKAELSHELVANVIDDAADEVQRRAMACIAEPETPNDLNPEENR